MEQWSIDFTSCLFEVRKRRRWKRLEGLSIGNVMSGLKESLNTDDTYTKLFLSLLCFLPRFFLLVALLARLVSGSLQYTCQTFEES